MNPPGIKILYLSYDGLTDPLGESQILPYLQGLSKHGYDITIVSFEKQQRFELNAQEISRYCQLNKLDWIPLSYHKKPPIISTLYDILVLQKKASELHKIKNFSIVHCRSYLTSLIGLNMKKYHGLKFIFDMRGFWADERVEGGLWDLKNPLYKMVYLFFKRKEREFILEADHIVSLTENAKLEIFSMAGRTVPVTVIPTCVDLDLFDRLTVSAFSISRRKKELGINPTDFILLYLGSWGTWYLRNEMLAFFSELKKIKSNSKFLIVSPDAVNIEEYPFKDDVIVCSVERKEVPLHICLANLSIFFIKPSFSKKASSATKLGEIMAMQCPVITNKGWGDVEAMAQNVLLLHDFTTESMREIIYSFLGSLSEINKIMIGSNDKLSLINGIKMYENVYKRVLERLQVSSI